MNLAPTAGILGGGWLNICRQRPFLTLCALFFAIVIPANAQPPKPYQVFLTTDNETGDVLVFVDALTGETNDIPVNGERYTAAGDRILFFNREQNQVQQVTPDGTVQPHPFIQPVASTYRLDWVVANNGEQIAWTTTTLNADNTLSTLTRVANTDGTNARDILIDGPLAGIRAFPVAFAAEPTALYMDYQPDGLGAFTPYNEYAGLFSVSLTAPDGITYLPNEPGCYCGAGFGGGYFLRLAVSQSLSSFNLRVFDLTAQIERTVNGDTPENFTQGGDILVSTDGTRAIYALARVRDFGSPGQVVQSVFMLVDLTAETQRQLTLPQTLFIRPVAWTEGNDAVIFTSPTRAGTWKMSMETGLLTEVSSAQFVGNISS